MPRRKTVTAHRHEMITPDGKTVTVVTNVRPGDSRFIEVAKRVGAKSGNYVVVPSEARTVRKENRGPHSGPSRFIGIKVKQDAYASIESRANELGVSVSEYFRLLVLTDIGVAT